MESTEGTSSPCVCDVRMILSPLDEMIRKPAGPNLVVFCFFFFYHRGIIKAFQGPGNHVNFFHVGSEEAKTKSSAKTHSPYSCLQPTPTLLCYTF